LSMSLIRSNPVTLWVYSLIMALTRNSQYATDR